MTHINFSDLITLSALTQTDFPQSLSINIHLIKAIGCTVYVFLVQATEARRGSVDVASFS
jgi:hypothetical protein